MSTSIKARTATKSATTIFSMCPHNMFINGTPQHNNGMHPTADTPDFMLLQWCGAAGDAGR